MNIVSLIAPKGGLDMALVQSLQAAWGGGDALWLSPDEAAEFPVLTVPGNLDDVRADIAEMRVDVNVVSAENRRKAVLLADMDSTMIQQECIDELGDVAGFGPQIQTITAQAMNGEIDFDGALRARVALLKGLPEAIIAQVLTERITLMPGAETLLATHKALGGYAALVSGGFTQFTGHIAGILGFDEHRANRLIVADGALTGEAGDPILGRDAKVQALNEITSTRGLTADDVLAVGDGANDLGMLKAAGLGVAAHAKPTVAAEAGVQINHCNLTALLFLQGIPATDFADSGPR